MAERGRRKVNRFLMHEPNEELTRRSDELDGASFVDAYGKSSDNRLSELAQGLDHILLTNDRNNVRAVGTPSHPSVIPDIDASSGAYPPTRCLEFVLLHCYWGLFLRHWNVYLFRGAVLARLTAIKLGPQAFCEQQTG